ncbi:MAG: hypothetical protein MI745_03810 [Pseudomonadales bacterium]|nr:hypothetical protein [Pseudomonadales bacterium]
MRQLLSISLASALLLGCASQARIAHEAPDDCQSLGEVSVSSGSKVQGLFFSDAMIESNVQKKVRKAVDKAGGNLGVIKDRREYMMESQFRGFERIELDAWVWQCEGAS